jgi:hypothetical protein
MNHPWIKEGAVWRYGNTSNVVSCMTYEGKEWWIINGNTKDRYIKVEDAQRTVAIVIDRKETEQAERRRREEEKAKEREARRIPIPVMNPEGFVVGTTETVKKPSISLKMEAWSFGKMMLFAAFIFVVVCLSTCAVML